MTNPHHHINYVEFRTNAPSETEAFYSKVFGWSFQDWGGYISFSGAGVEGGFDKGEPVAAEGAPLVILYSDDLASTLAAVEDAGGEITIPIFEFPGGKRFHFRDPGGNVLAVWGDPTGEAAP